MRKYTLQLDTDTMKEYGEFFKRMRLSIGYTLAEMSAEIGVFRTTLSKWEKGVTIPHQDIDDLEQRVRGIVKVKRNK